VLAVDPDPDSTYAPERLSDGAEVVARYRMEVATDARRVSVRFAVTREPVYRSEAFVSASPEYTREFTSFLLELGGDPLRSPVRWSRVLSSVVESVHRGIDRVFPTEFVTHA
jgi:hypothetical protein